MIDLVFTTLSKDATSCRRQELLLAVLGVSNLLGELLRWACHVWLLSRVADELVDHDTLLREIQLDVIQVLVLVQANLDAASTATDALHVVLVQCNINDVTCT